MANEKNYRQRDSAVSILFHKNYIPKISQYAIDELCGSYATLDDIKNTWRAKAPYSKNFSDSSLIHSRMFISMLDSRNPSSTNPDFLKALSILMADYLSAYFMRDPRFPTRKKAKEYLIQVFYDCNPHIQSLLKEQAFKRAKRQARDLSIRSTQAMKKGLYKDAAKQFANANSLKNNAFNPDRQK